MICNCTLAGTKACNNCLNNSSISDGKVGVFYDIYEKSGADINIIDEFTDYIKKNFKIGVNTIDDVAKGFKERLLELYDGGGEK